MGAVNPGWSYPADVDMVHAAAASPVAYVLAAYLQALLERVETIAVSVQDQEWREVLDGRMELMHAHVENLIERVAELERP